MIKIFKLFILISILGTSVSYAEEEIEAEGIPKMNAEQREELGIVTSTPELKNLANEIVVPGVITTNDYLSSVASPRIDAQVIKRHVKMGDKVKSGQPIVTLSSTEMAEAQGQLLIASREWQRVKALGKNIVTEQRFIEVSVEYQQKIATLLAYGMTKSQIDKFIINADASTATGDFELLSHQDGTVIEDQFLIGEIVESGRKLMVIADESNLWVKAQLNPQLISTVNLETSTRINVGDNDWITGKISQIYREIDESTRTLPVRIDISNDLGVMKPNQFVKVSLQLKSSQDVLSVPEESIVLLNGEQTIFVLEDNEISPQLVKTGMIRNGRIEIKAGISIEHNVVIKGAFLLKSMLLKSQIGDGD
jgi:cobalt-zinc-cadmium efflux system membrane fusion protein